MKQHLVWDIDMRDDMMPKAANCHVSASRSTMASLELMELNVGIAAHAMNLKDKFTVQGLHTMAVITDTALIHKGTALHVVVPNATPTRCGAATEMTVVDVRWVIVV